MILFIKNLFKIIILSIGGFAILLSCVPCEYVATHIWPFTIPLMFIIGAYGYTFNLSPEQMIEKFMKNK